MGASEQVLETHGIADTTGVFCCPQKLHTCSAQGAPFIDHAMRVTPVLAPWVSSLDERRTLRVQKQEADLMQWLEKELEDYIVSHPQELNALIFNSGGYEFSFLGRQVRCQYGIIDALFWARNARFSYAVVVECKAKHERGLAVEQVTRYQKAIAHADVYNGAPDDAWPIHAQDGQGWAWRINIKSLPVIIAPSFSNHLLTTFEGVLITAAPTDEGFTLIRQLDKLNYEGQEQLNFALAPVIRRAQIDAKTQHIQDSLGRCAPLRYEYSAN